MPEFDPPAFPDIPAESTVWAQDHIGADYTHYSLVMDYQTDERTLQGPVAGPRGTPAVFIRVASPTGRLVVTWAGRRNGLMPAVPDYKPPANSTAYVLLSRSFAPSPPMIDADGATRIFSIQGCYVYGLTLPIEELRSNYPNGSFPFDTTPLGAYAVGPENFRRTIFGFHQ